MKKRRCAIYTRKSTDEGLDQSFNSLDAQREACEAYISSQKHEGWQCIPQQFDDGAYSGGSMARPALQALLALVAANKVDIIVVYKVDRLTRSLADFAKMVEVFDEKGAPFVSVTQQFNTTTSMGRLTLNVLLSFAQFEREVTAERIRDKIAASKKKGMWMGGRVPIGYDNVDRKLVINEAEAATVRTLFGLYIENRSVRRVKACADTQGLKTKAGKACNGESIGRRSFGRGHIYALLSNPIYIGKVTHKGQVYDGIHAAIIVQETWDQVQAGLAENAVDRRNQKNIQQPSLLAGLLYDENGHRLSPSHANKSGKRYRYYITPSHRELDKPSEKGWCIPASAIEGAIKQEIACFLGDQVQLLSMSDNIEDAHPNPIPIFERAEAAKQALLIGAPEQQRQILVDLVHQITLKKDRIHISINPHFLAPGSVQSLFYLEIPVNFRRRGAETRIIVGVEKTADPDPVLIKLVSNAHRWMGELMNGKADSILELARDNGIYRTDLGRILPLAFLAPDIVEGIVAGRQPAELTAQYLKRIKYLPVEWAEQRRVLGFT